MDTIVNRNRWGASGTSGLAYSTCGDRWVPGRSWRFWYLHRSKKVWFRLSPQPAVHPPATGLLFCYDGRPILHHRERAAWIASWGELPAPVVWGKYLGVGWGRGPQDTTLFLNLWTRWTWLHPEACGHPERFSVVVPRPGFSPGVGRG
jgi:hypothetical protein